MKLKGRIDFPSEKKSIKVCVVTRKDQTVSVYTHYTYAEGKILAWDYTSRNTLADSYKKFTAEEASFAAMEGETHCLDLDLNDKRPGTTFDNGFIIKKINEN